jgi:hypothetical protein
LAFRYVRKRGFGNDATKATAVSAPAAVRDGIDGEHGVAVSPEHAPLLPLCWVSASFTRYSPYLSNSTDTSASTAGAKGGNLGAVASCTRSWPRKRLLPSSSSSRFRRDASPCLPLVFPQDFPQDFPSHVPPMCRQLAMCSRFSENERGRTMPRGPAALPIPFAQYFTHAHNLLVHTLSSSPLIPYPLPPLATSPQPRTYMLHLPSLRDKDDDVG